MVFLTNSTSFIDIINHVCNYRVIWNSMYPVTRKDNWRNNNTWSNKSRNRNFTSIVMVYRIWNGDFNMTASDMCQCLQKEYLLRWAHDYCSEGSDELYQKFIANDASFFNCNIMLLFIVQLCI